MELVGLGAVEPTYTWPQEHSYPTVFKGPNNFWGALGAPMEWYLHPMSPHTRLVPPVDPGEVHLPP